MAVEKISGKDFQSKVIDAGRPVLVDFFAEWCGPCKLLEPIVKDLSGVFSEQAGFVKVDIDEAPEVASKYAITGVPTLVIFKDGSEGSRKVGAAPKPVLEGWLKSNL